MVLLLGCAARSTVVQRSLPDEKDIAFQKMLVTLQDLGWTIKSSDKEAGLITAEKGGRRRKRAQVSITISPLDRGVSVRVAVTKAGAERRAEKEAEDILDHYR